MSVAVDRKRIYHKRDRLRQLRAFCRVTQLGSITRAADSLGLTQPAVSTHVRELERELEAVLFDRSVGGGASLALTTAGRRLYALSAPLVQDMDDLSVNFRERIDDTVMGGFQLAASVAGAAIVLPPYIKRLREQYPGIRMRVRNCLLSEGIKLLLHGAVELVLGAKEPYSEETLEYREILTYEIVLITSPNHPLAGRGTVSPEEAAAWPSIVPSDGTYSGQFGATAARQLGLDGKAVIEVSGWDAIKRCVETGLGIAVVPSICIRETDQLSVIPLREYFPIRSYGVFTNRGAFLSPPARQLLRLFKSDSPVPSLPQHCTTRRDESTETG